MHKKIDTLLKLKLFSTAKRRLFLTVACVIFVELLLMALGKITNKKLFTITDSIQIPAAREVDPLVESVKNRLKVAIFGGSTAKGYNSDYSFADLYKQYADSKNIESTKNKNVYVKNFAEEGKPIHGYGIEIAKRIVNDFDVFVFYVGTNETSIGFIDRGYYKGSEYISVNEGMIDGLVKLLPDVIQNVFSNIGKVIQNQSRIYRLLKTATIWLVPPHLLYRDAKMNKWRRSHILSADERNNIATRLVKDISNFSESIRGTGKKIIVLAEPSNVFFPPECSVGSVLSENVLTKIEEKYRDRDGYLDSSSIETLKEVINREPDVAIANYLYGMNLYRQGKKLEAKKYLIHAVDSDCVADRPISKVRDALAIFKSSHDSISSVNVMDLFYRYFDSEDYFISAYSDPVHPNVLGHALVGVLLDLSIENPNAYAKDVTLENQKLRVGHIIESTTVNEERKKQTLLMSARWNILKSFKSNNAHLLISFALKQLNRFDSLTKAGDIDDKVKSGMFRIMAHISDQNEKMIIESIRHTKLIDLKGFRKKLGEGFPGVGTSLRDRLLVGGYLMQALK